MTSTSNNTGQIQSTIIDTSSNSVLTCLYNNEKNLKNYLSKVLHLLCSCNDAAQRLSIRGFPTLRGSPKKGRKVKMSARGRRNDLQGRYCLPPASDLLALHVLVFPLSFPLASDACHAGYGFPRLA